MLFVVNKIEELGDKYECEHTTELHLVLTETKVKHFIRKELSKRVQHIRKKEYNLIQDYQIYSIEDTHITHLLNTISEDSFAEPYLSKLYRVSLNLRYFHDNDLVEEFEDIREEYNNLIEQSNILIEEIIDLIEEL